MKIFTIWATLLVLLLIIIFPIALMVGRYDISANVFYDIILGGSGAHPMESSIIFNLRVPRTCIAAIAGAALSVSGLIYQETFRNPLVSPDLLGVTSGASVGAASAIVIGMATLMVSLFAFLAGIVAVVLTIAVSRIFRSRSSAVLVLSGIFVGGFMGACLSLIKYFADPESTLADITFWLMGSCASAVMLDVWILLVSVLPCIIILMMIGWRINIVSLGREEAQTRGINYNHYRNGIIVLSTFMTACAVSFVGTIGWVGLVVPHIVRLMLGDKLGSDARKTIPLTALFGAIFIVVADVVSRTFTSAEIPLGVITGVSGIAVFIAIIAFRRRAGSEINMHE